ncbi:NAD(+) diphosphatase [Lysobacter sp. N42]|uniref:NAD(+) diphosphatase n=1 Tax=Lysobacter sp. N42 TaxID=2545719 RepID=UPI001051CE6D|nr:NAD(+) diphosphatase [Lysobacter sp. N42]TCZ85019.1 NAD(+) diphosphatase [Lysobacter sp. N42]
MSPARGEGPFAYVEADPVAAALDRADHLRGDMRALADAWAGARLIAVDAEGLALAGADGRLFDLDPGRVDFDPERALFLGLDAAGRAWFALDAGVADVDAPQRRDLRAAAANWPAPEAAAFAQARALLHWRRRHRHCGACGGALAFSRGGWLGRCAACALDHYPRTDPAVIVAVGDGDRLLLGRQAAWPARRWSVIAGFVEPGESLEQTVAREVHEETGVRVRACRYLASQPWPFPSALMLGFIAEAEPGCQARASDELEDARWFERTEIEAALAAEARGTPDEGPFLLPSRISIAHWLVRQWLAARVD